ncbi:PFGI-1 class ICE element type IV pilus protein PilL2 [Serratia ficaria]|nr:PilL N-terminal domain-containing protein [Serratia ficaria]CAI2538576.1 integrating conjugative element protein PilL, PFGI-1 class [Serratia ficaria]
MSGCATTTPLPKATQTAKPAITPAKPKFVPVIRYGRYTLVELAPASAQQDLLLQVVDVAIPDTRSATVGDALRHVLLRSGYQLCPVGDITALNSLPLPASHYRLGPMLLHDALLTLAGPAWDMKVDDSARRICFNRAQQPSFNQPQSLPQSALKAAGHVERRPLKTEIRP